MQAEAVIPSPLFATTHWTVVLRARGRDSPEAGEALSQLCRVYWYPLYAFARGRGHGIEDAQDLTQGFFAQLIEKDYLHFADRRRGRFRCFLLTAFKCFLANEWDRARAQKRGGDYSISTLEMSQGESEFQQEPWVDASPDRVFDRRWAITLLAKVRKRLADEYRAGGKGDRYARLEAYLPGEDRQQSYAAVAAELGISEGAVKVEVHRMKRRFGDLLRAEISQTVASEAELDEEIRYLISVVADPDLSSPAPAGPRISGPRMDD
jgi:DNA-directed RNA polymerase specialized sigma24 family protein